MHRTNTYIIAVCGLLLCVGFLLSIPTVTFASVYTVAPLVIDQNLQKRDIQTVNITLVNKDTHVVRIFPTVNEVAVDKGGTIQSFVAPAMGNTATSVTSWLEIPRGRIELQPDETKEIPLTIRISPEAQAGDYHAFVGFPEGSDRPDAEKKIQDGQVPGTMVRIGIDQEQDEFLRLDRFVISRFVKTNDRKNKITYEIANPGSGPITPTGEIIFYDNLGNEVGSSTVNTEAKSIDAGQTVTFTQDVPSYLKMGKYKALLTVEYGKMQTLSLNDTAYFYVLALKQLIALFVIVLLLAVGIALYFHRRFDMRPSDNDGSVDVAMYVREGRSESKEHDIDLSNKN